MLKRLFTSKVRVKLLKVFLSNPDQEYFIRELTRKLDEQINSVRRELDNLKKAGLLNFKTKNRKKYYIVNKNFILFPELQSIVAKSENTNNDFIEKLSKIGKIDFLLLGGMFINKPAEVDLLIVGELNKEDLAIFLDKNLDKPVKFAAMHQEDFLYRLKINDQFLLTALKNPENIIAINKLENHFD
jgi:predicted transcriptional regulator